MSNYKACKLLATILLLCCGFTITEAKATLHLVQVLNDNDGGVDGLGNPRRVSILADNSRVFVASGDDNAMAVFNVDKQFELTFHQVFKNDPPRIRGLEGASDIVSLNVGSRVMVSGFYDGAIASFSEDAGTYRFTSTLGDGLTYDQVFASGVSVGARDRLGLLGPWEMVKTHDEKQVFVASYISNAIALFDVSANTSLVFNRQVKDIQPMANSLGKPVGLALSPANDQLYVIGYEDHQLTIFARDSSEHLTVKQVIQTHLGRQAPCLNPQDIVVAPSGEFLYVACVGSNTIVVFQKSSHGQFKVLQTVQGIPGVSSLAITANGKALYAAAESAAGIFSFSVETSGLVRFASKHLSVKGNTLAGISSITLSQDNAHLLVTTGKNNALLVFNITGAD